LSHEVRRYRHSLTSKGQRVQFELDELESVEHSKLSRQIKLHRRICSQSLSIVCNSVDFSGSAWMLMLLRSESILLVVGSRIGASKPRPLSLSSGGPPASDEACRR
jgi:hypothetical protein